MPRRYAEASRTVIRASTTAHSSVFCLLQTDEAGRRQRPPSEHAAHDSPKWFGDQVLRFQIDRRRLDARAVMHMCGHIGGERRAGFQCGEAMLSKCCFG